MLQKIGSFLTKIIKQKFRSLKTELAKNELISILTGKNGQLWKLSLVIFFTFSYDLDL